MRADITDVFFTLGIAFSSLAFQLSPAQQARVAWVPNPRTANSTWVSDASHHLRPATLDSINSIIGALERETGAEIAVAVVDSMAGLEAQEFATALHRYWGVGKRGRDNGVLLLWNPVHRDIFISVGLGLEGAIPDRRAGRIRDEIFAEFRQRHFDEGIVAGVTSIAAAARADSGGTRRGLTPGMDNGVAVKDRNRAGGIFAIIGGVLAGLASLIGGAFGIRRWRRYRPRNCSNGHPMRLLDERADDDKLDQGAKAEERLGSINWDVWVCPTCDEVLRVPFAKWTSPYEKCTKCARKTMSETVRTVVAATTSHGGSETVIRFCSNCGYRNETTRSTPRKVESSSSSGSGFSGGSSSGGGGGGSFGGGSAGGGGAGGRY
jgi:uncharacterized protein